jgi:hypothetical protein
MPKMLGNSVISRAWQILPSILRGSVMARARRDFYTRPY